MAIPKDKFGFPLRDSGINISRGSIDGYSAFSSMGERTNTGTAATGEDVTEIAVQDIMPVPAAGGEQLTIVSTEADDASAGTGVQTVQIDYLDGDGLEQTEVLTMNGDTGVDTVATDITFVNDMYALTVGSGTVAAGDITIYKKGAASTIYNLIQASGNKSLVINRKIPSNKELFITGWTVGVNGGNVMSARLRSNCDNEGNLVGCFLFKRTVKTGGDISFFEVVDPPIKICSNALVKISLWSAGSNNDVSASFNGILVG